MSETPIIPLKQAHITIGDKSFVAVLLPNGQAGLVFVELCEWLGLKATDQGQRLRAHATLSTALVLALVQTPGGPQATNAIEAWGIPLWLGRLRPGARPPLYRERLLVLLRDAFVTLSKQHFQEPGEEPASRKQEKPSVGLERSPSIREARQAIRRARDALAQAEEQWMDLVEQRQQALEERLQRQEGRPAPSRPAYPEEFVGSIPLTVAQYQTLLDLLRQLQRRSRVPLESLAAQLADHCSADHLSAISQSAWPEALAWVNRRLGAR